MSSRTSLPVGLISNPGSGHNRDRFEALAARLQRCPNIIHRITQSPDDIDPALDTLAQAAPALLAINGGDGTASAVLGRVLERGLYGKLPRILLLPGGTANMNAGDIGVRGSLSRAVERLCRWCETGQPEPAAVARRPMLRVSCGGDSAPRYCMFLGAGAVMQGTEYAHRNIHSRGLRDDFSLALGTARTVWGLHRKDPAFDRPLDILDISLRLDDGQIHHHDTLILAISTLQRLAFGMRPFWGDGSGRLRLTLIERHCPRFLRTFISIARGKPNRQALEGPGYLSHNADRIELQLNGDLDSLPDLGGRGEAEGESMPVFRPFGGNGGDDLTKSDREIGQSQVRQTVNLDGEILHVQGAMCITASEDLEFIRL